MARGGSIGKLGKLKCMIKRWHHASGHGKLLPSAGSGASTTPADVDDSWPGAEEGLNDGCDGGTDEGVPPGLHPVYVGKSRRRYLIGSHLVDHPLLRVLVQRSGGAAEDDGESTTVVGCEVVMFEHLLWMLEHADPHSESLDELAEFYAS